MSTLSSCSKLTLPSESAEMADVDVTPVMNMFIILIPFLVSMAVFTHLSILPFTVPPNVSEGLDRSEGMPSLRLTVVAANDHMAVTLGEEMLDSIPAGESGHDYSRLTASIQAIRPQLELQEEMIVASRDGVRFQQLVDVMDIGRSAGFSKIGISSATEDPSKGR